MGTEIIIGLIAFVIGFGGASHIQGKKVDALEDQNEKLIMKIEAVDQDRENAIKVGNENAANVVEVNDRLTVCLQDLEKVRTDQIQYGIENRKDEIKLGDIADGVWGTSWGAGIIPDDVVF